MIKNWLMEIVCLVGTMASSNISAFGNYEPPKPQILKKKHG